MTNDRLDAAIDDVAHEMTAGDPHDAAIFRRRVLATIARHDAPPRSRRIVWILSPVGAAAAIAIALALLRPSAPRTPADGSRPATLPPPAVVADRSTAVGPAANRARPDLPDSTRRTRVPRSAATNANSGGGQAALDAFAPAALTIDPIGVNPIGVTRLGVADPITIDQLDAIAPIAVTPLEIDAPQRRQQ